MRQLSISLSLAAALQVCSLPADVTGPEGGIRVLGPAFTNRAISAPTLEGTTLRGMDPGSGKIVQLDLDEVQLLRFPVVGEDLLAYRKKEVLHIREPVAFPLRPLPDGVRYAFTIPMEAGLYFTPLVGPSGGARRNTFRFWIGEGRIHAQSRGAGRTEMNEMEDWNIGIPSGADQDIHVELFIDRKGEICHLRINHRHVKTWSIPTSYEEDVDGDTTAVIRSGIDPQHVENLTIQTWQSRRYPDPEKFSSGTQDHLWLQNGDLLSGRVTGIANGIVQVALDTGQQLALAFDRILEIRFASASNRSGGR